MYGSLMPLTAIGKIPIYLYIRGYIRLSLTILHMGVKPMELSLPIFLSRQDKVYSAIIAQKKEYIYDVSFIGLVAGCAKRLELLDAVAKYCVKHHKKMICYGHFWHNAHPLQNAIESIKFKIKHPHLYRFVVNKRICAQDAANIYQHTRINLNIHIPKHSGFNCRTFEILGGHNFELCDIQNLEYIKLEDGEHIVFYKNKQDLLEKIAYYLNNDTKREKIANQGGAYVNEYYSFDKSLQKIFRCNK